MTVRHKKEAKFAAWEIIYFVTIICLASKHIAYDIRLLKQRAQAQIGLQFTNSILLITNIQKIMGFFLLHKMFFFSIVFKLFTYYHTL